MFVLAVSVAWTGWHIEAAKGAGFGVLISLANTLLIAWRMTRGRAQGELSAQRHLRQFYRSWIERYAVLIALFALAFAVFELAPAALLAGFILGQLVWIIAPLTFDAKRSL